MLQCKNVTKKYMKMTAVNGVSIDFMPGRIYALLGSNGSGKTTLMKMIAGLVKPTSGDITLSGVPIGVETKKHIAYMPTESYFYNYMSCADIGKYYADFFEDFSLDQYYNYLNEMKLTPDMKASKMSSGMMAKLKLAVNLSRNASVICLMNHLTASSSSTRWLDMMIILSGEALLITALITCSLATISTPLSGSSSIITDAFLERLTASLSLAIIPDYILLAFMSGVSFISLR